MLQSLLSLMLAAVQVLAWNAAPVYLCLEVDGSACVDRGPAFCDCCQSGESSHDCGGGECDEPEHEGLVTGERSLNEGPCGCEHEQISDAQAAVKTQNRSAFELTENPLSVANPVDTVIVSSPGELLDRAIQEPSSSSALAARAGVVLRL